MEKDFRNSDPGFHVLPGRTGHVRPGLWSVQTLTTAVREQRKPDHNGQHLSPDVTEGDGWPHGMVCCHELSSIIADLMQYRREEGMETCLWAMSIRAQLRKGLHLHLREDGPHPGAILQKDSSHSALMLGPSETFFVQNRVNYSFSDNDFEKARGRRSYWRISPTDNALKIIIWKTITPDLQTIP